MSNQLLIVVTDSSQSFLERFGGKKKKKDPEVGRERL